MSKVIIVGAGLAGLTAAFRLADAHEVCILEASGHIGGQIRTTREHGYTVERGAEGFVFRSEAVPRLATDLGMAHELIGQSTMRSYGFDGTRLHELGPGEAAAFLGFQVPKEDFGKGIRSLRRGMGSLPEALHEQLRDRADIRRQQPVVRVEPRPQGAAAVLSDGQVLEADLVVIATVARSAATLLRDAFDPAAALSVAKTLSSVTVELGFERKDIDHPLDGTGFVVAEEAQRGGLRACTFTSSKFADRAPPDRASLRVFFRPNQAQLADSDAQWAHHALSGVRRVLRLHGEPLHAWVSRWPDALPVFDSAHSASISELERALAGTQIQLAGSAFHGSGIDAAVRSGETTGQVGARLS